MEEITMFTNLCKGNGFIVVLCWLWYFMFCEIGNEHLLLAAYESNITDVKNELSNFDNMCRFSNKPIFLLAKKKNDEDKVCLHIRVVNKQSELYFPIIYYICLVVLSGITTMYGYFVCNIWKNTFNVLSVVVFFIIKNLSK
jgi:hypothetical protein